jgi:outer membrane protein OmpA-like peptidoglycan-associated protein
MKHRNLWLGTAALALIIGAGSSAFSQEYSRAKAYEKPAVEVDMSMLNSDAAPKSDTEKPRIAEYQYLRSPSIEDEDKPEAKDAAPAPAPEELPTEEVSTPKAVPPVMPAAPVKKAVEVRSAPVPAAQTKKKPSLVITNTPAPAKPVATAAQKSTEPAKPAIGITSQPTPETPKPPVVAAQAAPAVPSNAIISQPPKSDAPVAVAPMHHDLSKSAPIISSPPDAKAPPVQGRIAPPEEAVPAPAAAAVPEVVSVPEAVDTPAPAPEAKAPAASAVVSAPVTEAAPAPKRAIVSVPPSADPKPAPAIVSTPPEVSPSAPSYVQGEQRPVANPLPDITVIHEADNPEVSDAAPVAQPVPRPRGPRDEPPTLPSSSRPGHSTVDSIPAFAQAARPVPTVEPAPETSASPPAQFEAASAAAPVVAPPATPAPPEEVTMPVVPTMADLTLAFPGNSSDLTTETQKKLDSVIRQMKDMGEGRLQVRGFATGEDGSKSSARRIALSRALSVRSYLMDKGIKATRVDVRAMGSETERSPLDRVDLIFAR